MKTIRVVFLLLLTGCAGAPQVHEVKEVYLCAADECGPAGRRYSGAQVLQALYRLLKANEGKDYTICSSSPETRSCESEGVGYFVMGGPIPGYGHSGPVALHDIKLDSASQSLLSTAKGNIRWLGTPVLCAERKSTLLVRSANEITITDEPHYCTWMALGHMTITFSFAVETIDFDKGRLAGYWSHASAGIGVGKGSGYGVLQFPVSMPAGENWLAK